MAKGTPRQPVDLPAAAGQVERKMVDFAEDLGRILGTAQARASAWLEQRQDIIKQLTQVRDTATHLLTQFAAGAVAGTRRGRPPRTGRKRGRPAGGGSSTVAPRKRRKMSAVARAKIATAQRARWAKQKASAKK